MKEKLLMAAASLLGFATACDTKEELRSIAMYGVPYMNYKVKGKVTDKEGNPIPGIVVSGSEAKPATSGSDGAYELTGKETSQRIEVSFTDTDGPANGGEFAEKRIEVKFTDADRTNGEFSRSGVDATLEEKE